MPAGSAKTLQKWQGKITQLEKIVSVFSCDKKKKSKTRNKAEIKTVSQQSELSNNKPGS